MTTRRRFLALAGVAAGLGIGLAGRHDARVRHIWRGFALGGLARIVLLDGDRVRAQGLGNAVVAEIARLEAVFSLHRPSSEIVRLNRAGAIERPSWDLVVVLDRALEVAAASGGAFDPTVQPLWRLYARHFARPDPPPVGPPAPAREAMLGLVGWDAIELGRARVRLGRKDAAITLNGIAQGYIADRVAALARDAGFESVFVDCGEIVARAGRGHEPWEIEAVRRVTLRDGAVATSAPSGTVFEPTGRFHHLIDPRTGACARGPEAVTVVAPTATIADAISTALAVSPVGEIPDLLRRFPGAAAYVRGASRTG